MLGEFFDKASRKVLSVSEITDRIKRLLEENLADLWIVGEISNYRKASSGHIYFTLKDERSVLRAVLFKGNQVRQRFELGDGLKVILHGNLSVFDKRGEYQVIVDYVEPEGVGALQLAFEQLKEKLGKEGLFDPARKKQIPPFPDAVGVVTSPTGAALRDVLNITERRYGGIRIVIYPALVQGQGAGAQVAAAIRKANERAEVDVLIVGRGGGSMEDLWPFNEEVVARAICESTIPVISAVGHETDFTISDFAADVRAPTPSAAAELVVKNKAEIIGRARELTVRLTSAVDRIVSLKRERASLYAHEYLVRRVATLLNEKTLILDDLTRAMGSAFDAALARAKGRFEALAGQLNALSPLGILSRGFAVVLKLPENRPVRSIFDVELGDDLKTRLRDGCLFSVLRGREEAQ